MKRNFIIYSFLLLFIGSACENVLEPEPVDILTDDVVLNEPKDVPNVEVGLYSAFRSIIPSTVIAGDFTSDMLIHNGTFSNFRELGTKQITSANGSVTALWGSIYNTVYIANFILDRLPQVPGVKTSDRNRVTGVAHFLRGYAYFVALFTYGGVPKVLTIPIENNISIPRASEQEILDLIFADYTEALNYLPAESVNAGFVNRHTVHAALARLYLYLGSWSQAEQFASEVINSSKYQLEPNFLTLVNSDLTKESIFEVVYTLSDDPGTNSTIGLNNLFVSRREIIPSNQAIIALASNESGDRFRSISFDSDNLKGTDNGWSVAKYGTADENNNDVVVFRLGEMYLIRAEARAQLGKISGAGSAIEDVNVLRNRANAQNITSSPTQTQMLLLIEEERRYELAFEGHRWYDLVRTGRVNQVMSSFSSNWRDAYTRWPIPQREILNNPALAGQQNPGY